MPKGTRCVRPLQFLLKRWRLLPRCGRQRRIRRARIPGKRCAVFMVETLGNGRFRVDGRLADAAGGRRSTWVCRDDSTYVIEPDSRDASYRVHVADDQMALSAPMPATVVAIS